MTLSETFARLGLPKHSADIYERLESHGPMQVATLSRALKVHRPAIYRALAALTSSALVSCRTVGRRMHYSAEPRSRIAKIFAGESLDVGTLAENKSGQQGGAVQYFEGPAGITAIFNDVISRTKRGDTFYRYTSERDVDHVNRYLSSDYRKRRDAKHLERLVISNPESGRRKRPRLERFIKFLDGERESLRHNAIQLIYGSRIAFIDLNTERSFIIENATLAEFQKTIFKALYKRL